MMKWLIILVVISLLYPPQSNAFQYASLPSDNLIQNPWFRSSNCKWSDAGWTTSPVGLWGQSDKVQDPTDVNCVVGGDTWVGFAERFARKSGAPQEFFPNVDAKVWQVVGPVNANDRKLYFHSLIVAHRVNQYKAEIYGSNSANGPWTSVWKPFDVACTTPGDCLNEKYGAACNPHPILGRDCLWDDVTEDIMPLNPQNIIDPQGPLKPVSFVSPQGYSYYKIEFLMNYPNPDASSTGNVGGKLARVYFKVAPASGTTPNPTPTFTPAPTPTPTPMGTPTPTPSISPTPGGPNGDVTNDGKVDSEDAQKMFENWFGSLGRADIFDDNKVNSLDFHTIWSQFEF